MKKISAFEIISEAFSLLFGNLKYLFKKLWFVNTLFLISSIMLFIFGAYDGLVVDLFYRHQPTFFPGHSHCCYGKG